MSSYLDEAEVVAERLPCTPRQARVLVCLAHGLDVTETARVMAISRAMVVEHLGNVTADTGRGRTRLVLDVIREGWVHPTPPPPALVFTQPQSVVLQRVAAGWSNPEIAEHLGLSLTAVRKRLNTAARRARVVTGRPVRTRLHLAILALLTGDVL